MERRFVDIVGGRGSQRGREAFRGVDVGNKERSSDHGRNFLRGFLRSKVSSKDRRSGRGLDMVRVSREVTSNRSLHGLRAHSLGEVAGEHLVGSVLSNVKR